MSDGMFTTRPWCGNGKFITIEDGETWYTTCHQSPEHDGPHIGFISWEVGEEPSEDETPMTMEQIADKLGV